MATIFEEDFVVSDLDLADESELRRVVAEVETLVAPQGRGTRVSVLTAEQWNTVVKRLLMNTSQASMRHYIHTLRDPSDPQHLLVSPSAVAGINDGSRIMYQDFVYAFLRCLPSDFHGPLRRGLDDIIAEEAGRRIGVELFCRNYPRERDIVGNVLRILSAEFGHPQIDWAIQLRRSPRRVLMALQKSGFRQFWLEAVGERAPKGSEDMVEMLLDPSWDFEEPLASETEQLLDKYKGNKKQ